MAKPVRIYFKKKIKVDHLTIPQYAMFQIATVGVAQVKDRVQHTQNANDVAAAPLTKRYAIRKTKLGKGNRRNLTFTGDMLRNLTVRTVSDNKAVSSLTTRKDRDKARANNARELWLAYSGNNRARIVTAAQRVVNDLKPRLLVSTFLNS